MVLYYGAKLKNSGETLDPETFKEKWKQDSGVVIDVRTKSEHKGERLDITDHNYDITDSEFSEQIEQLDKSKTYYLYCRTGSRSGRAARMMEQNGFEHVYNIGGLQKLLNAGFNKQSGN
ncbi:rhodanese-like domain-containing protein [Balneolaceae bacterium YR4-1]|uniref:Rhodanese-like domain-containing protein n=2 Tax=Halalkalibaculum roseum TaxID=2709311 RepID=A0A6M1SSG8_9BACT|nr:rhodanese-like domain-containing protein [Halalkalibaculum roseum]